MIGCCLSLSWKGVSVRKTAWAREEIFFFFFEDFELVLDGVMVEVSMIRTLKENEQW